MQSFSDFVDYISKHTTLEGHASDHVCIIINDHAEDWNSDAERLLAITWHSLIKWRYRDSQEDYYTVRNNIIFSNTLEEALHKTSQYDFAFITTSGFTYSKNISHYFDDFKQSNILYKRDISLYTLFVNLKEWRSINAPHLKDLIAKETTGNNYYLLSTDELQLRTPVELLQNEFSIDDPNWNILYVNNNERYVESKYVNLSKRYDVIYSHAGGAVAEFLWKEYGHRNTKLVVYDSHLATLEWKRKCYSVANSYDDVMGIARIVAKKYSSSIDECNYRNALINSNKEIFPNEVWVKCLGEIENVVFIHTDIVRDAPLDVDTNKTNLLYLSNIFAYPPTIHRNDVLSIHDKFTYYTSLANTTVFGDNVFMDAILIDNADIIKLKHN